MVAVVARIHQQPPSSNRQRTRQERFHLNMLHKLWHRSAGDVRHVLGKLISIELGQLGNNAAIKRQEQILTQPHAHKWGKRCKQQFSLITFMKADISPINDETEIRKGLYEHFKGRWDAPEWRFLDWIWQALDKDFETTITLENFLLALQEAPNAESFPESDQCAIEMMRPLLKVDTSRLPSITILALLFLDWEAEFQSDFIHAAFDGAVKRGRGLSGCGFV